MASNITIVKRVSKVFDSQIRFPWSSFFSPSLEFYNIHPTVLQKSMDVLVKRGVAATFQGANFEEMGVKFFKAGA